VGSTPTASAKEHNMTHQQYTDKLKRRRLLIELIILTPEQTEELSILSKEVAAYEVSIQTKKRN